MLIQNEIQAMSKDPSEHTVVLDRDQFAIEMKDRMYDQDSDRLLMYDQGVLHLLIFVVKEMLAVLEFVNHSHLEVLKYYVLEETLPIIFRLNGNAYSDFTQIGHPLLTVTLLHQVFTTENNLKFSTNLGLSSSLMLNIYIIICIVFGMQLL